jgi:membrane protease subunit HflK
MKILSMAGKRSPWGKGGDGSGDGGGSEPTNPPAGDAGQPAGGADEPVGGEPPREPKNPWHRPGGDGPPRRSASIEDIFRARTGGGGSGGGGGRGFPGLPRRADGKSWLPRILGLLAVVWIGMTSTHVIGQKEKGIVTTFGKYSRTLEAGVQFTLPWPLESVRSRDVTTIILTKIPDSDGENLILTSDANLVDLSYQVRWQVSDLKRYSFELPDPDATIQEVAEAAMRASVAEMPLNAVWGGSGRGELQDNVRRRMQGILDAYRAGVNVVGVEVNRADPPNKVAEAFQRVNIAQQDAQRAISQAEGWAQTRINKAQGDATEFDKVYEQYRLAPEVTKRRLYYETMEYLLANNDKVVVEGNGVMPYLPLPEVRRKASQGDQGVTVGGQ